MTLWEIHKGDKVVSPKYPGEILSVLEEPHPMMMDAGLDCKFKRLNGDVVFIRDYEAVKSEQFTKVQGFEDMPKSDLEIFIENEVKNQIRPLAEKLKKAKRVDKRGLQAMADSIDIFIAEIHSTIL